MTSATLEFPGKKKGRIMDSQFSHHPPALAGVWISQSGSADGAEIPAILCTLIRQVNGDWNRFLL